MQAIKYQEQVWLLKARTKHRAHTRGLADTVHIMKNTK
jgi:hypothetical protein